MPGDEQMKHLADMAIFASVVDAQGLGNAARVLGLTTSAVSRSVSRLESHFGGQLLNRNHRALSVTELGASVYTACAAITRTAREIDTLASQYSSTPNGRLRISAPAIYGEMYLAQRLPRFMAQWPDLDLSVDLTNREVDPMREAFDIAIRIGSAASLPPSAIARTLGSVTNILVASPGCLIDMGLPHRPSDLQSRALLCLDARLAGTELVFQQGSSESRLQLRRRLSIASGTALTLAAFDDIGLALLPDYAVVEQLHMGTLVRLLPDWSLAAVETEHVHILYSPTRHVSRKVRAFIDFLLLCKQEEAS